MEEKTKIDWISSFYLISLGYILGFLAIGLPQKICKLNGFANNCTYGIVASYTMICLFFWLLTKDIKICRNCENTTKENEEINT